MPCRACIAYRFITITSWCTCAFDTWYYGRELLLTCLHGRLRHSDRRFGVGGSPYLSNLNDNSDFYEESSASNDAPMLESIDRCLTGSPVSMRISSGHDPGNYSSSYGHITLLSLSAVVSKYMTFSKAIHQVTILYLSFSHFYPDGITETRPMG